MFRVRGVRSLLASGDARTGVTFAKAREIVRDKIHPHAPGTSFETTASFLGETRPEDVLRRLIGWEVLRPGLRLECPNCLINSVIDVDDIGREIQCPLCGARTLLGARAGEWVYSLSGVFQREGGDQGAIPGLLTWGELDHLGTMRDQVFFLPAHDLKTPTRLCETDLMSMEISPMTGRPAFCVGESKSTASRIDEKDVENLLEVRSLLRGTGIECYVVLSILREQFTDDELSIVRGAAVGLAGELTVGGETPGPASPFIMFSLSDLESDPTISRALLPPGLPHQTPRSFQELAENSRARYYP
jgi:hypothetical protein